LKFVFLTLALLRNNSAPDLGDPMTRLLPLLAVHNE
jgi:hypothetical protein